MIAEIVRALLRVHNESEKSLEEIVRPEYAVIIQLCTAARKIAHDTPLYGRLHFGIVPLAVHVAPYGSGVFNTYIQPFKNGLLHFSFEVELLGAVPGNIFREYLIELVCKPEIAGRFEHRLHHIRVLLCESREPPAPSGIMTCGDVAYIIGLYDLGHALYDVQHAQAVDIHSLGTFGYQDHSVLRKLSEYLFRKLIKAGCFRKAHGQHAVAEFIGPDDLLVYLFQTFAGFLYSRQRSGVGRL